MLTSVVRETEPVSPYVTDCDGVIRDRVALVVVLIESVRDSDAVRVSVKDTVVVAFTEIEPVLFTDSVSDPVIIAVAVCDRDLTSGVFVLSLLLVLVSECENVLCCEMVGVPVTFGRLTEGCDTLIVPLIDIDVVRVGVGGSLVDEKVSVGVPVADCDVDPRWVSVADVVTLNVGSEEIDSVDLTVVVAVEVAVADLLPSVIDASDDSVAVAVLVLDLAKVTDRLVLSVGVKFSELLFVSVSLIERDRTRVSELLTVRAAVCVEVFDPEAVVVMEKDVGNDDVSVTDSDTDVDIG